MCGGGYSAYTYDDFLENITLKQAHKFIELIQIRQHNNNCTLASFHGIDTKKSIIRRSKKTKIKKIDEKAKKTLDDAAKNYLKNLQNGR